MEISRKLVAIFLLLNFVLTIFSSAGFAQSRRRATTPNKQQTAKVRVEKNGETCNGWRGKITYVQNINEENLQNKGEFGYDKYTKVVQITGEVVLNGGSTGEAKVSHIKRDIHDTEDHRRADCGNFNTPERKNTFVEKYFTQMEESGEATGKVPATVVMSNGDFHFDISMPAVNGKFSMQSKHSQKGYCTASADNEENPAPIEQAKEFDSLRIYAEGKYDPKNPNVLRGSVKYDPNITITWDLTRVSGADCDDGNLAVFDVKLEQHVFPNPTAWQEIEDQTIDGNTVKITATVSNSSKKPKGGTLIFKEKTSGETINAKAVNVPGESESTVSVEWDTNGFAWTDDKKKAPQREIEVSLIDGDSQSKEIWVHPKPVVLVHGLWSNGAAWAEYHNYLEEAHSFAWKAYAVGENPKVAEMHTGDHFGNVEPTYSIRQNAQELAKQILFTQKTENAWHIDLVAHSMGGLISRFYINGLMPDSPDGKPLVKNLVMLGTPNQGSPWADIMYQKYKDKGFEVEALRELKTDVCREFNRQVTNRKGVKFAIVYTDKVPFTGDTLEPGDGVVSYSSAVWQISDVSRSDSLEHTSLTGKEDFMRFVYPRLAIGPKKAKQTASLRENFENPFINRINQNWLASLNQNGFVFSGNFEEMPELSIQDEKIKSVDLQPNQAVELEIPTAKVRRGGIAFAAPAEISATLIDTDGEVIGENLAGTPDSSSFFRYIVVDQPIKAGTWKIKLENTGEKQAEVTVVLVFNTNPLELEFTEIQIQNTGAVTLQARLTDENGNVKGANVSAKIQGQDREIVLFDDGLHNDGEANDGVYGGMTTVLPPAEYLIEAKAAIRGLNISASTNLTISQTN